MAFSFLLVTLLDAIKAHPSHIYGQQVSLYKEGRNELRMMTNESTKKDGLGMASLDPQLVHRILLTDPSQIASLVAATGGGDHSEETPTFDDFCKELSSSPDQSVENTMKRAYRERISGLVHTSRDMKPLHELLLELHGAERALVPNRSDLHSMLKDEEVRKTKTPEEILPHLVAAGDALSRLESEYRSESTREWLQKAQSNDVRAMDLKESIEFAVTSILYLLLKAELCQKDKHAFFLANVWAPRIHNQGPELERQAFEARYGKFQDKDTAPLTRKWISELVSQSDREELVESASAREAMVKQGWTNEVLFRSPDRPALSMPEILVLDFEQLNSIRFVTRSAAAGSALCLHACNAAGVSTSVLEEPVDATSSIELRRRGVAEAMNSHHISKFRKDYEENVGKAVVRLAEEWKESLGSEAEAQLKSRTTSVLRAEDPVILLLDTRMKEVFSTLMKWSPTSASVEMRSGRADSPRASDAAGRAFLMAAKSDFCKRGLSFYASDLANVSYLAKKVADLAWKVYGEPMLDKMIIDACKAAKIDPE